MVSLSIAFTGDWIITRAPQFQSLVNDRQLTIKPSDTWAIVNEKLDTLISQGSKFGTVVFSGHGTRHCADMHGKNDDVDIKLEDLVGPTTDAYKFLKKLGANMAPGAEIII